MGPGVRAQCLCKCVINRTQSSQHCMLCISHREHFAHLELKPLRLSKRFVRGKICRAEDGMRCRWMTRSTRVGGVRCRS